MDPAAIVFDLDGVLVDSEQLWDEVRRAVVADRGGRWTADATAAMQGMSTPEWAQYLTTLGASGTPRELAKAVTEGMAGRYRRHVPLLPGAVEAVTALSGRWRLGVASSSPPDLIGVVLAAAGVAGRFRVAVSSEEVARGKPAPDVYLAAAAKLDAEPATCVAIEDSANGLRAAAAAGMVVVAVPNQQYPPPADALAVARAAVRTPAGLTPELVDQL
jgi:HAD superfamily hydrolase (TIGR01509 family)